MDFEQKLELMRECVICLKMFDVPDRAPLLEPCQHNVRRPSFIEISQHPISNNFNCFVCNSLVPGSELPLNRLLADLIGAKAVIERLE